MADKRTYSIQEAAEMLSISVGLLKQEIYVGRIEAVKFGLWTLVPRSGC